MDNNKQEASDSESLLEIALAGWWQAVDHDTVVPTAAIFCRDVNTYVEASIADPSIPLSLKEFLATVVGSMTLQLVLLAKSQGYDRETLLKLATETKTEGGKRICKMCGNDVPEREYGDHNDPEITSFALCGYCQHKSSKDD